MLCLAWLICLLSLCAGYGPFGPCWKLPQDTVWPSICTQNGVLPSFYPIILVRWPFSEGYKQRVYGSPNTTKTSLIKIQTEILVLNVHPPPHPVASKGSQLTCGKILWSRRSESSVIAIGCFFGVQKLYPLVNIQKTMENHRFEWENSLFLWPFSIAM